MRPLHPITLLVLAELAACGPALPPPPPPPIEPEGPSMPIATDGPAEPRVEPAPEPRDPAPPRDPRRCRVASDCPPGEQCALPFDGNKRTPGAGWCRPPGPMPGGRPLFVDGAARVSRPASSRAWLAGDAASPIEPDEARDVRDAHCAWLRAAAFDEHASVAAFARTICQLLALGAPASLVLRTQRALADEIRHAEQTFAWLERLGGETLGPGPLPEAAAPIDASPAALLRDVFRGGCVGETIAAYEADARAAAAGDGALGAFYRRVAEDEARHAALAYDTARWLVASFPELRAALDEERARAAGELDAERSALLAPLLELLS